MGAAWGRGTDPEWLFEAVVTVATATALFCIFAIQKWRMVAIAFICLSVAHIIVVATFRVVDGYRHATVMVSAAGDPTRARQNSHVVEFTLDDAGTIGAALQRSHVLTAAQAVRCYGVARRPPEPPTLVAAHLAQSATALVNCGDLQIRGKIRDTRGCPRYCGSQ